MRSKDETAQFIADAHFHLNSGIHRILRIVENDEANDSKPIKLLEVNDITPEVGIMPIGLTADPSRGVNYAVTVVEISPGEFERLANGQLTLPHGWTLAEELLPTKETSGAAS